MQDGYRKRRRGSVIFDPYYKVQIWDKANLVWSDVQNRFTSQLEAEKNSPPNEKTRIIEITMGGRRVI